MRYQNNRPPLHRWGPTIESVIGGERLESAAETARSPQPFGSSVTVRSGRPVLVLVAMMIVAWAGPVSAAEPDEAAVVVTGVIAVNGDPAWAGIVLTAERVETGEACGTATVGEAGKYTMALTEPCTAGVEVVAVIQGPGKQATEPVELAAGQDPITYDASFTLDDPELALLPPRPDADGSGQDAASTALVQKATSVFDEVELLLVVLISVSALVLGAMVIAYGWEARRRYAFLSTSFKEIPKNDEKAIEAWATAAGGDDVDRQNRTRVFRWMVEGLVMSFVIIALIAMGGAGKISDEGIISVLAAMVGYAAGRATN